MFAIADLSRVFWPTNVFKGRDPSLSFINIQGLMELSLRRHIISSLKPTYISNTILHARSWLLTQ
jgi:hypothetical protein